MVELGSCTGFGKGQGRHGLGEKTRGSQFTSGREKGVSFLAFTLHFPPSLRLAHGEAHGAGYAWMG